MATGLSLHIGLNTVDPAKYGGWDGRLVACENDAHDLARIAGDAGFETSVVLTADGTVKNITSELHKAAERLVRDDILLFTYSGHGGQVPDTTGPDDEPDRRDETLVLYDRELLDDELRREFARFADGVRILVFLDSCHSGSAVELAPGAGAAVRAMPDDKQREIYERDRDFFQGLQRRLREDRGREEPASALLISACQDDQTASDGPVNGLFTETLLKVWNHGAFTEDYRTFHEDIVNRMPRNQTPNLYLLGSPGEDFLAQRPFTV
ncbi:caspase domain-containing protein [Streptomyces sp. NPDC020141]|uniref:caspase domain-containing protein n=1 Tax=Streptomyces sp. NPDC020141 TaxID=3365065 RepID=UPI00379D7ED8